MQATPPGSTKPIQLGRIDLVRFISTTGLQALGEGLYQATEQAGEPLAGHPGEERLGTLRQGHLEGSNVKLVDEMVQLMVAQRAYEASVKLAQAADEMLGMVNNLQVMIAAVVASVGLMMVASAPIGEFVSRHPTVKMLALSFLLVIGVVLIADAFGHHVPKGYIYTAMVFSVFIELINMRQRRKAKPVHLRNPYGGETEALGDERQTLQKVGMLGADGVASREQSTAS